MERRVVNGILTLLNLSFIFVQTGLHACIVLVLIVLNSFMVGQTAGRHTCIVLVLEAVLFTCLSVCH